MSVWDSFWAVVLWFLWAFVFIAYLMALFSILMDIFRDPQLKGWGKALWVVFLVFVPFLTALIYLIARGGGMAQRSNSQARSHQDATDEYIRTVAGTSPAEEIERASHLLAAGSITGEEFASLKAKALA